MCHVRTLGNATAALPLRCAIALLSLHGLVASGTAPGIVGEHGTAGYSSPMLISTASPSSTAINEWFSADSAEYSPAFMSG